MTKEELMKLQTYKMFEDEEAVYVDRNDVLELLEQEPCDDAISRQAVLDGLASIAKAKAKSDAQKSLMGRVMFFTEHLPPVTPKQIECEDAISRADAVKVASGYCHPANIAKELAKLPPVTPKLTECEDAISRQAAIDALGEKPLDWTEDEYELGLQNQWKHDVDAIKALPPATPQPKCSCDQIKWERDMAIAQLNELGYGLGEKPKVGHWIKEFNDLEGEVKFTCSSCKKHQPFETDFCYNCGSDNRGRTIVKES